MAKRLKMPALALTDRNNLYGAVHFYTLAQKAGVKPIIGMDVDLDDGSSLVLLARNFDGYKNLCHLATVLRLHSDPEAFPPAGFDDEDEEIPPWEAGVWGVPVFGFTPKLTSIAPSRPPKEARLSRELILSGRHVRGLIALSGGKHGLVNSLLMKGKTQSAARAAGMLLSAFGEGNFFIELQATCEGNRQAVPSLVALANNLNIPIVATNNLLYARPEDRATAQALAAARNGARVHHAQDMGLEAEEGNTNLPGSREDVESERYFRSDEEMARLFSDYPQALANTHFIAEQCNVELPIGKPLFPSVEIPTNETPYSRLWKLCFAGATRRYRPLIGPAIARLKYELEVIDRLGFCPYFLVVHDIVRFAHSHDIPIMARGSAANSLTAYVLGITQIDPLQHDLLFERFLNPSRAEFEMPDIDLDLCWRRRDEVLRYVYEHFGRDHVAIVGTYITFRQRSAWREMAKALGISAERINRVASRLHHAVSPEEVLDGSDDLPVLRGIVEAPMEGQDNYDPTGANLDTLSQKLRDGREREALQLCKAIEGLPRHAGMHCGGVVITPTPIADLIPLQRATRDPSLAITQYDKDAIEAMGLVKMDLLGSRALTALVDALHASGLAQGKGDVQRSLDTIPFDDPATYRMMAQGETLGCFQLESPGMRALLKWLRPRSLNDIAIAISLFRPGPLEGGFLETFMRRRLGQEPVTYHHPAMQPILEETGGVILYQEQFLKLAHALAGLDLGDAEKLRKDLGKARTPEERTRLGSWFIAGAIERGIDQIQAEKVWDVMAGYTGFGFCKAHACSYALTAYRSAYMKAHYPAEFLASVVNNGGGYYGPNVYLEDARRLQVELLPPDVNISGAWCAVPAPPRSRGIRLGLQFIKGLSERTIAALVGERQNRGRYNALPDLMGRVDMKPQEVEALVKVGACDSLGNDTNMPHIATIQGDLGEAMWATYVPALTRKQMVWLLPSFLSLRSKSKSRSTFYRARNNTAATHIHLLKATGSDGPSMQMVMGEFDLTQSSESSGGPKILGSGLGHIEVPDVGDYTLQEKLRLEQEVIGFSVSRNEMELYGDILGKQGVTNSSELAQHAGREVTIAGVVVAGRRHTTKGGEPMLFFTLQDVNGIIETVLFPEAYKENGEVLANGGYGPYLVRGVVQVSGTGRGIGVLPPADLRPADAASIKMHPVVIASEVRLLMVEQ
jgi:DNA-directed DNA polymerase III PolC